MKRRTGFLEAALRDPAWKERLTSAWVNMLCRFEWVLFTTHTFREIPNEEQADRKWRSWISETGRAVVGDYRQRTRCELPRRVRRAPLTWARATELQRRGAIHFHALIGASGPLLHDLRQIHRVDLALAWQRRAGHADVQLIQSRALVVKYVAKYVTKAAEIDIEQGEGYDFVPFDLPQVSLGTPTCVAPSEEPLVTLPAVAGGTTVPAIHREV